MKKILTILVVLAVVAVGGWFGLKQYRKWLVKKEPFVWGVTVRPHAIGKFSKSTWNKQLQLAKGLGVNYVRMSWQYDAYFNSKLDPFGFHDNIIGMNEKQKLKTYMVIEANPDVLEVKDPYMDGYNSAFQIAAKFKGRIKYYQLLNESASVALKSPDNSGEKEEDYDSEKYVKARDWIKGASDGIKKADSSAYRVVTDQWTHTAFFDMLVKDKVDFDIIGWDWFSDMGLMQDKKLGDGTLIIDKLKSFNKPIILAEVNARPEGRNGQKGQDEDKQSEFIKNMAQFAKDSNLKGFIVLELLDVTNTGRGYTDYYGIVNTTEKNNGVGTIGEAKKAYNTYKEIIVKYQ